MNKNLLNPETVTVEVIIDAPLEKVWKCWTEPKHVIHWNFASADWESPYGENDLKIGGKFNYRMQAKDGSFGFDFVGKYTNIKELELIEYVLDDNRHVKIFFTKTPHGIKVREIFEIEKINPQAMQQKGWQAILDNFKKYTENTNQS